MKIAVVLLTWKRLSALPGTLKRLRGQTFDKFDVIISNANLEEGAIKVVDKYVNYYKNKGLRITARHDGNEIYAFRRFYIGRDLRKEGYDVVLFIDDDIRFPSNYISSCIKQYEPRTYKSGFTWIFYNRGKNYYKFRKRVYTNDVDIHYGGTGICMIDASIFEDPNLIKKAPEPAYRTEDLWLSYFVYHKRGWKIKYMDTPNVIIGGSDAVALYRQVQKDKIDKAGFLRLLVKMGWQIPATIPKILT